MMAILMTMDWKTWKNRTSHAALARLTGRNSREHQQERQEAWRALGSLSVIGTHQQTDARVLLCLSKGSIGGSTLDENEREDRGSRPLS